MTPIETGVVVFLSVLLGYAIVAPFYGALYEFGYRLGEWWEDRL